MAREEGSLLELSITVMGLMHCGRLFSREYFELEGSGFVILGPNQDQGGPLLLKSKFGWKKLLMEEDWLLGKIWRVVKYTKRNKL